ncbi:MAG: hypothetical protein ABT940_11165, partial [Alphaproteobacteria bacterium]
MTEEKVLTIQNPSYLMPAMSIAGAVERFNALARFTREIMAPDRDYGTVPGSTKPTLLKPGAEKLTTFFGLSARPSLIEKAEDWTGSDHGGEPFFYYWFRYGLYRGDLLVAEADGSCNSWETKYRYRTAERTCPSCGKAMIIKGKQEYGGGWLCFAKKGGCGAKFKDGDRSIEGQEVGKVQNPNPADIANTVLKMAQKRALVAATLLAVNASEYFTQDLEDLDMGPVIDVAPTSPKADPPKAEVVPPKPAEPAAQPNPPADPQAPPVGHANGNGKKLSTVKTAHWTKAAAALAEQELRYQKRDG